MDNLPAEISSDIFSRLSAGEVLKCQRVCKTWRNLLLSPSFAAMHLQLANNDYDLNNGVGSKVCLSLIFLVKSVELDATSHPLYYGEFSKDNNDDHSREGTQTAPRLINHPLLRTSYSGRENPYRINLVSSCNGLICFAEPTKNGPGDPIHICNPITRECLYLQEFDKNDYHDVSKICSGFGYIPQTNEYKVVRILYRNHSRGRGDIQVCTLGDGSGWRNKGVITCNSFYPTSGVFFRGDLYWTLDLGSNNKIMAFNLSEETFRVLPLPAPPQGTKRILQSFGDWLCVGSLRNVKLWEFFFDIWSLKKTSSETTIGATDNKAESWCWCKEFSISIKSSWKWKISPFAITKTGLVLLMLNEFDPRCPRRDHRDAQTIFCYDPETAIMERLGTWRFFEVVPHTNSFVSLKGLGETTFKKKKNRPSSSTSRRLASLVPPSP